MEMPSTRPQPVYREPLPPPAYPQGYAPPAPQFVPNPPPVQSPPPPVPQPQHRAPRQGWTTEKRLWAGGIAVFVIGVAAIGVAATSGSSGGGGANGATGVLSPAGQQVQQDGYGSIQQTSVNGLPVALGTNSAGGQELVETWPNATQASEALASTQDTDVMTGNYTNITGLSTNGDLLIIDGSGEGIQYILSNTGISF
jgi:hypothetical protein